MRSLKRLTLPTLWAPGSPRRTGAWLVIGLAILFWGVLFRSQQLCFRDVGHFYTPLYQYLGEELRHGHLPLWNDLDHTGIPVAGETTTALYYPPRLLFALPIPTSTAMGWYLCLHLLLAGGGAAFAARVARVRPLAIPLVAVAYAFACPIISLTNNPPFLVGAAWLPWGLAGGWRLLSSRSGLHRRCAAPPANRGRFIIGTGTAWAMAILGGDPQTVFHIGLLLMGSWFFQQFRQRSRIGLGPGNVLATGKPLAVAALLAVGIALPQLLASFAWSAQASRRFELPPGIHQLLHPGRLPQGHAGVANQTTANPAWWHAPAEPSHAAEVYRFSVAPWHWLDLLLPGATGSLYPQYRRWTVLVADDSRIWSVSVYCGLIPLLMAFAHWVRRLRQPGTMLVRLRSLDLWDLLAPIGLVLAMGRYGLVWAVQWFLPGDPEDPSMLDRLHPAIFTPYWFLVTLVPGYGSFRYPAKWLPVVCLGVAIGAGRLLPLALRRSRLFAKRLSAAAFGCWILAGVLSLSMVQHWLLGRFPELTVADPYWGPLQLVQSLENLQKSATHVAIVLTAVAFLCCKKQRFAQLSANHHRRGLQAGPSRRNVAWFPMLLTLIVMLDLLVANVSQVATISTLQQNTWGALYRSVNPILPANASLLRTGERAPRIWQHVSSPYRLEEVAASERFTLQGRWHLSESVRVFNSSSSLPPQRYQAFVRAAAAWQQRVAPAAAATVRYPYAQPLGINTLWHTPGTAIRARLANGAPARLAGVDGFAFADDTPEAVDRSPDRLSWHHHWNRIPPTSAVTADDWLRRFQAWSHPGATPLVETCQTARAIPASAMERGFSALPKVTMTTLSRGTDECRYRITSDRAGLLRRATLQDGHWRCHYRSAGASVSQAWNATDVHRVDYLCQGVYLPAGDWEVHFEYRPWFLWPSRFVAIATVLGCIVVLVRSLTR